MCFGVCSHACGSVYVCVFLHVCTHVYACTNVYTQEHIGTYSWVCACVCVCVLACMHMCVHVPVQVCVCVWSEDNLGESVLPFHHVDPGAISASSDEDSDGDLYSPFR